MVSKLEVSILNASNDKILPFLKSLRRVGIRSGRNDTYLNHKNSDLDTTGKHYLNENNTLRLVWCMTLRIKIRIFIRTIFTRLICTMYNVYRIISYFFPLNSLNLNGLK